MNHLLTLGLLLLLSTTSLLCQDTWVKVYGGNSQESGSSMNTTADGCVLVSGGTYSNDVDFKGINKGAGDIFLFKLDNNGELLWNRLFGGSQVDWCLSMTTTSDGSILITGLTQSDNADFERMSKGPGDIFLFKLDKDGRLLWKKTFGGTGDEYGSSMTTTSDDGVLITGQTFSNDGDFKGMNKSSGYYDAFVIKLDKNGDVRWKKVFGGTGYEYGYSITTTSDGSVLITGTTHSNDVDFEGMNKGGDDIFVVKLDKNGELLWKKVFGGAGDETGYSITTTSDGSIQVTGKTKSNNGDFEGMNKDGDDVFVFKLDENGELLWKKLYGGTGNEFGYSMTTTLDGSVLITGGTSSNDGDFERINKGNNDVFVIKLDKNGDLRWKKVFGGTENEFGYSMTTTSDGNIQVTGKTNSNDGDFKGMNKGGDDVFVIKLDSNGNYIPSTSINEQSSTSTPLLVTPNPLSTSSTIRYNLEAPSLVRIELMNTMGQVVEVIFDGYGESGTQRIPFNVSSLTSGMYLVRMISDKGAQTTQVCVVR